MPLVITDMSALRYYRFAKADLLPAPRPCDVQSLREATAPFEAVNPSDLDWRHIAPSVLAEHGVIVRAAVEPVLAAAAKTRHAPDIDDLYYFDAMPADDKDLHRQVLRNLLRWSRSAVNAQGIATPQADAPLGDMLAYDFPRLDLLVGDQADKRKSASVLTHIWKDELPSGALMRINDSTLIISPEMLLTRLSILCPDAPHLLAVLGLELAGRYALLPRGFVDCGKLIDEGRELVSSNGYLLGDGYLAAKAALDPDRLGRFFELVAKKRGGHARKVALPWIQAGSESPLETDSDVSLVFPRLSGGFSVGKVELNAEVTLSAEARALYGGKRTCRLDQLFASHGGRKIDIEPGGDAWHRGAAWKKDNNRRQALEHDGYEVVAVSWDDFADFEHWKVIAEDVADRLGRGLGPASDRIRLRQAAVHADLCDPNLLRETFGR